MIPNDFLFIYSQGTSPGQELLETIFKHLNLIETAYFGLRFIDNTGQTVSKSCFFLLIVWI